MGAIGGPEQKPGQGQAHITGGLGLAERLPLGIEGSRQDRREVPQVGKPTKTFLPEESGVRCGDERGMGHGRHAGNLLQKPNVRGGGTECKISHQQAIRLAPELTVFPGVDLLV